MEILERSDNLGPATALTPKERSIIIELARIGKNDVFYDLGSGHGHLVVDVVRKTRAKRVVGIEVNYNRFCRSVRLAQRSLSKHQLKRIDFYCANYDTLDFADATVIYEGHERESGEVEKFTEVLKCTKARIITIDLPLIRCRPRKTACHKQTKFFVVRMPLNKGKARSKDQWAAWVMQRSATISDVYSDYDLLLKQRGFSKKVRKKVRRELGAVVNSYFSR